MTQLVSHIREAVQVLATAFWTQLPAGKLDGKNDSTARVPATHVQKQDGVPGSWLLTGLTLDLMVVWGVNK